MIEEGVQFAASSQPNVQFITHSRKWRHNVTAYLREELKNIKSQVKAVNEKIATSGLTDSLEGLLTLLLTEKTRLLRTNKIKPSTPTPHCPTR